MFSSALIALLVALSAATWIYTKVMRRTGNNTQNSLVTAGLGGLAVFVIILTIISLVNSALG